MKDFLDKMLNPLLGDALKTSPAGRFRKYIEMESKMSRIAERRCECCERRFETCGCGPAQDFCGHCSFCKKHHPDAIVDHVYEHPAIVIARSMNALGLKTKLQ